MLNSIIRLFGNYYSSNMLLNHTRLLRLITSITSFRTKRKVKQFSTLFANIVGGNLIVKVNNLPGYVEIDIRSHILRRILIHKNYEPRVVELIKRNINSNKDAINVGANVGLLSILMANLIREDRKVLAVEPTINAYSQLERNIKRNKLENRIVPVNSVAADHKGKFQLNTIEGKEEYSSLAEIAHDSVKGCSFTITEVDGDTIDNLTAKYNIQPGMIVIDVEGAEYQVFLGAINTIRDYAPIIITELNDKLLMKLNSNSKEVISLLLSNGYIIKNVENSSVSFPFNGNIIAFPVPKT